jgi:glycosyltransferase involved in cell wall biosynthesis
VFVHSPGLLERKGRFNVNTQMVSNGVDFRAYSQQYREPLDLAAIPHPRIGYTGWLKKHLDWRLLIHLTDIHPDWSFVFVGPTSPHPEVDKPLQDLKQRRNVYFLGCKSVEDLASYPQHFDVCLMPYVMNDYTKYIYPLKLHEYLAGGRPTVGTRIRTLESFSGLVGLAITPEEWSKAILQALRPDANLPDRVGARQALARKHDWETLVKQIAVTIAQRLGPEFVDRLESGCKSVVPFIPEVDRFSLPGDC